jgi:hypothetical protein
VVFSGQLRQEESETHHTRHDVSLVHFFVCRRARSQTPGRSTHTAGILAEAAPDEIAAAEIAAAAAAAKEASAKKDAHKWEQVLNELLAAGALEEKAAAEKAAATADHAEGAELGGQEFFDEDATAKQTIESVGGETEVHEGDEAHEADTLGNGELDPWKQQEDVLHFWNETKAAVAAQAPAAASAADEADEEKAAADAEEKADAVKEAAENEGPSVGTDGS